MEDIMLSGAPPGEGRCRRPTSCSLRWQRYSFNYLWQVNSPEVRRWTVSAPRNVSPPVRSPPHQGARRAAPSAPHAPRKHTPVRSVGRRGAGCDRNSRRRNRDARRAGRTPVREPAGIRATAPCRPDASCQSAPPRADRQVARGENSAADRDRRVLPSTASAWPHVIDRFCIINGRRIVRSRHGRWCFILPEPACAGGHQIPRPGSRQSQFPREMLTGPGDV
jgi:hypothetical protein